MSSTRVRAVIYLCVLSTTFIESMESLKDSSLKVAYEYPNSDILLPRDVDTLLGACHFKNNASLAWKLFAEHMTWKVHEKSVTCSAFVKNDAYILTGSLDGTVSLSSIETRGVIKTMKAHDGKINALVVSHDGQFFVTVGTDKCAHIWKMEDFSLIKTLAHPQAVTCVAISHNNKYIATGSADGIMRLFDAQQARCIAQKTHFEPNECHLYGCICAINFTQNDARIIAGAKQVLKIWDLKTDEVVIYGSYDPAEFPSSMVIDDGFALCGYATGDIAEIGNESHLKKTLPKLSGISSLALSGDHKILVTGSFNALVYLWDDKLKFIRSFKGNTLTVKTSTLSADGCSLVTGDCAGVLHVWSFSRLTRLITLKQAQWICTFPSRAIKKHVFLNDFIERVMYWTLDKDVKTIIDKAFVIHIE